MTPCPDLFCPFPECNGRIFYVCTHQVGESFATVPEHYYFCCKCGLCGPYQATKAAALRDWKRIVVNTKRTKTQREEMGR